MRILVVDDDPGTLNAVRIGLIIHDHEVVTARDGNSAIKIIESEHKEAQPLDLLLTDLKMPFISGLELIHWAKRADPSLPCVLVTAFGNEEIRKEVESIGSCRYIEKPLKLEDLIEVITKLASRTKA